MTVIFDGAASAVDQRAGWSRVKGDQGSSLGRAMRVAKEDSELLRVGGARVNELMAERE